jgi:hypothetical protein
LLNTGVVQKILLAAVALFVCCMVCNGELYRLRPHPSHLTRYYLSIAVGGAIGGIIVAVVAPNLFLVLQELQLGLVLCCLLFLTTVFNDPVSRMRKARYRWAWAVSVIGVVLMAAWTWFLATGLLSNTVYTDRDFFGLVRVKELGRADPATPHRMEMYSGTTLHGLQLLGPELRRMPTAYYGPTTGAGVLLSAYGSPRGRRVGMVGMGVGTLSAYGRPGDVFVYYELNPSVVDIAYEYFSFLEDSPSEHEIRLGDARLNLEREPDQEFDILVLDAFNSDSIPVHLLTIEAMEVYGRHLRRDGVIAIHVTNTFLDLFPLVYNLAEATGFHAIGVVNAPRTEVGTLDSAWALLSRDASVLRGFAETAQPLRSEGVLGFIRPTAEVRARVGAWTDDFSNLFELLSLNR